MCANQPELGMGQIVEILNRLNGTEIDPIEDIINLVKKELNNTVNSIGSYERPGLDNFRTDEGPGGFRVVIIGENMYVPQVKRSDKDGSLHIIIHKIPTVGNRIDDVINHVTANYYYGMGNHVTKSNDMMIYPDYFMFSWTTPPFEEIKADLERLFPNIVVSLVGNQVRVEVPSSPEVKKPNEVHTIIKELIAYVTENYSRITESNIVVLDEMNSEGTYKLRPEELNEEAHAFFRSTYTGIVENLKERFPSLDIISEEAYVHVRFSRVKTSKIFQSLTEANIAYEDVLDEQDIDLALSQSPLSHAFLTLIKKLVSNAYSYLVAVLDKVYEKRLEEGSIKLPAKKPVYSLAEYLNSLPKGEGETKKALLDKHYPNHSINNPELKFEKRKWAKDIEGLLERIGSMFHATMTIREMKNKLGVAVAKSSFLIDETFMIFLPDGIKFFCIDSSHVCLLRALLGKGSFTDFNLSGPSFKYGINFSDLLKVILAYTITTKAGLEEEEIVIHVDSTMAYMQLGRFKIKRSVISGYDEKEEGLIEDFDETLKDKFHWVFSQTTESLGDRVKKALKISDLAKFVASPRYGVAEVKDWLKKNVKESVNQPLMESSFLPGSRKKSGYIIQTTWFEPSFDTIKSRMEEEFLGIEVNKARMKNSDVVILSIEIPSYIIDCTDDGVVYIFADDESGSYSDFVSYASRENPRKGVEGEDIGEGIFSLNFLENIIKIPGVATKGKGEKERPIEIHLGNNVPVKVYERLDEHSVMLYLLAPRVEDQNQDEFEEEESDTEEQLAVQEAVKEPEKPKATAEETGSEAESQEASSSETVPAIIAQKVNAYKHKLMRIGHRDPKA